MSGFPPVVQLSPATVTGVRAGDPITVLAIVADADNRTEQLVTDGPAGGGTTVHVDTTMTFVDQDIVHWRWQGDVLFATGINPITVPAPATDRILECLVSDGQGNETIVQCPVSVIPAMLVGVDPAALSTENLGVVYAAHQKLYTGLQYMRVFGSPTHGIPPANGGLIAAMPASVTPHVSYKDVLSTAQLSTWMTGLTRRAIVTPHHEPEGDLTVDLYRAGFSILDAARAAHPNGHLVTSCTILTRYAEVHKSYNWRDWACAADGTPLADMMSWDCYLDVADKYTDPATFFAPLLAAEKELGTPWGVSELGAVRLASDPNGAGRAAWIADCLAFLDEAGCRFVAWWCGPGSSGKDFHLDQDAPELGAWRAAIPA